MKSVGLSWLCERLSRRSPEAAQPFRHDRPMRIEKLEPRSLLSAMPPAEFLAGAADLPQLTGLVFTSKAPDHLAFRWNPVDGASGYRIERSADGADFSELTAVGDVTSYVDAAVEPTREYYYRVYGVNEHGCSQGTATIFAATPSDSVLPVPWAGQDLGTPGGSGCVRLDGDTFTLIASGSDIWGRQDACHFVYRPLEGDGQIVGRVASLEDTDRFAKAGLMMRETLDANASNVLVRVTHDNGAGIQWRPASAGQTYSSSHSDADAPQWFRLSRNGQTFTAEQSEDGGVWTLVEAVDINMASSIYVGLALTSHDNTELNTATFDAVTVQAAGNTAPLALRDSVEVREDGETAVAVLANDSDGDGDSLAVVQFTQGRHGSVADGGDGTLVYRPQPGFVGNDAFTYTIADGRQGYDTTTVDVGVLGLVHHWRLDEGQGLAVGDSKFNALGTAVNVDGSPWTAGHYGGALSLDGRDDYVEMGTDLSETLGGTASLALWVRTGQVGNLVYRDAPGITGSQTLDSDNEVRWGWLDQSGRLRISAGGCDGATTTDPINDNRWHHVALTRNADTGMTEVYVDGSLSDGAAAGTELKTTSFSRLGCIHDPAGTPEHFQGDLDDVRVFNYVLDAADVAALVENGPPVATPDAAATAEDTPVRIEVTANDSDPEGDPLSVSYVLIPASHGQVQIDDDGSVIYAAEADWWGEDWFAYRVDDGRGQLSAAAVRVEVWPVNDPPTAANDTAYTNVGTATGIGVLANDADVDPDALTVVGFTQGGHGSVVRNVDDTLTYTPGDGFVGADTFSYTVSDGHGACDTAQVRVGVGTEVGRDDPADTFVDYAGVTFNNADSPELLVAGEGNGREVQTLLRFENLFGPEAGQIPEGAWIDRASLELQITNPGQAIRVHRMLGPWQDTDTWSSLGEGIQTDDVEAAAVADTTSGSVGAGRLTIDVTTSLRFWSDHGDMDFGWVLLPTGADGVDFCSSEGDVPPHLQVRYVAPADAAGAEVVARHVFYNHSAFDGNRVMADAGDDEAIAAEKQALLPGETARFANYTSFSRGINGVMIDVAGLPRGTSLEVADFAFRVGNDNDPSTWAIAPAPGEIAVRPGDGAAGSDRVTIVWPDHSIQKQWLQVTMLPTRNTGLVEADVFYFGNAVGEAGNSTGDARVNATDMLLARNNPRTFLDPAPIGFPYDFNRDARVNATDMLLARNNQTHFLSALRLISVPAAKDSKYLFPGADWTYELPRWTMGEPWSAGGRGTKRAVEVLMDRLDEIPEAR
ncbi:MAG: tandem-95 repeat protein [Pirellulales bacterium]|nr:tandem-95 repeat protein [Pirellulales bacterium]